MIDKKISRRETAFFLSSVGMGLALVWFYFFGEFWLSTESGSATYPGYIAYHLLWLLSLCLFFVSVSFLGSRFEMVLWRRVLLAVGLVFCASSGITAYLIFKGFASGDEVYFLAAVLSGASFGSLFCMWLQSCSPQTGKEMMSLASAAFLCAGACSLPWILVPIHASFISVILPFLFVLLFFVAGAIWPQRGREADRIYTEARPSSPKGISVALLYASLSGLALGLLNTASPAIVATGIDYLSIFAITGIVFFFVTHLFPQSITIEPYFMLTGVMVCVVSLLSFVVSDTDELLIILSGVLQWSCILLVLAASFQGKIGRSSPITYACLSVLLFFFATDIGRLLALLSPLSRYLNLGIAAVLFIISMYLVQKKRILAVVEPGVVSQRGGVRESLFHDFAQQHQLTPRETEVFVMLADGSSLRSVAGRLYLSENTLKTHRANIYQKLGVKTKQEMLDKIHSTECKNEAERSAGRVSE